MKRFRLVVAALLVFALSPFAGAAAFANDGGADSGAAGGGSGGTGNAVQAAGGTTAITDPLTNKNWEGLLQKDTANVGRIWTDKSVSADSILFSDNEGVSAGDSAFVTALSVLSSTSNIASTATTPLDVVLVLDASGSMGYTMGNGSRMKALQDAANGFIEQIAVQNEGISDASLQHQVSIVKFAGNKTDRVGNETYYEGGYRYNYSQVVKQMAPCTSVTSEDFKAQINSIKPSGATRADNGLALAQGQTSGRNGEDGGVAAKKVVVFFADGTPTKGTGFDNEVASSAVTSAKSMKDAGASVYTIGIFEGVNPDLDPTKRGVSDENKFMQAVSSNYPSATFAKNGWGGYDWSFGTRAENSSFYKSAKDADELARVFEEISKEIVAGAGYPTKTTEGAELDSGFITFDDPLGAYMQVDDVSAIVMNGEKFEGKTVSHEGNVTTYSFDGAVSIDDKRVLLANIDIVVTKSDDAATGDIVQVKVPAGMIPLRNFNVNENEMTMSVTDTKPLSVFYTSSLKGDVSSLLAKPDAAMSAYLQANMTENGQATFLANQWSGELGDVTASFEPSPKNSYYYFARDVPIYEDQQFTKRATEVKAGETYWYQHDFYKMENDGSAALMHGSISFPGDAAEAFKGAIGYDAQGAFFKAGTARLTYIDDLHMGKEENATGTAEDVLNPKWNDTKATSAATMVNSHLGNNGKLSVDVPGSLTVTKQIEVPEGYSLEDYAGTEFSFGLVVPEAAGKTFAAGVTDADGNAVAGGITSLTFDADGNATFALEGGQTLHAYGLAGGSTYTVVEAKRAGWNCEASGQKGRIVAGQTSEETFVNKYAASGNLGDNVFIGSKTLTGREWTANDRFVFELKAASVSPDAPLPDFTVPEGVTPEAGSAYVEVTEEPGFPAGDHTDFKFGDITYTKPGTYTYEIWESERASNILSGVSPSQALYRVVVTVVDKEHNGNLTVTTEWKKLFDDSGKPVPKESQGETPGGAAFVNEYDTTTVKWNPSGTKLYNDTTGAFGFTRGMFNVALCTNDDAAPLPPEGSAEPITATIDGVPWRGVITAVEEGGSISFPQMEYGYADLGKRFQYKIVEVVKDAEGNWVAVKDMTQGSAAIPGMTYDPTVWTVNVSITENDEHVLELTAEYSKDGVLTNGTMFSFRNTYEPMPAKATVSGSKVLTGRDMLDGESFGFALAAVNDAAKSVLPEAKQAEVSGLSAGTEGAFEFDGLTFTKPGTYLFKLYENAYYSGSLPVDGVSGITFDRHECTVKVVVTDDGSGALKAEVSYEGAGSVEGHPEQFVNRFADEIRYGDVGGLEVVKMLTGRDMVAGEFSFAIEGANEASAAKLTEADRSFANHARAAGGEDVMQKLNDARFTAEDAGKTFAFNVSEVVPADDQKLAGVTYANPAMHRVEIAVSINQTNGHLQVATRVDGEEANVATVGDDGKVSVTGATARVAFVNAYKAGDVSFDTAKAGLRKVLEGRDWLDGDAFAFKIEALEGAPLPCDTAGNLIENATVNRYNASNFSFGTITFTSDMVADAPGRTKTFAYRVTEVEPAEGKLPGIEYSTNAATIKVTVRDDGTGALKASAVTENGTFVNRYAAQIDYTAAGGLNVAKTLTGRDMAEGQFTMRVTPDDEASAQALGMLSEGRDVSMPAAVDGQQVVKSVLGTDSVVFTQNDVGQTYTYTVAELGEAPDGYTYDAAVRTVTITVSDNPSVGALTVTTVVAGGLDGERTFTYAATGEAAPAAVVPFTNSYFATTDTPGGAAASVTATKELTGRPLADGEFTFAVKHDAAGGNDVLTAKNTADGTVTFGALNYDTRSLADLVEGGLATKSATADGKPQWTVPYVVYEKTDGLAAEGVTAQTQPIVFTVTVVDNGNGTMTATANVSEGLLFKNAYAADKASVDFTGVKQLQVEEGLQPADIAGKFTFTVTSDDPAAPMPERTSVTNDAQGKVDFGAIEFTLDDLNRALGVTSGNAAGEVAAAAVESGAGEAVGAAVAVDGDEAADAVVTVKNGADAADRVSSVSAGEAVDDADAAHAAGKGTEVVGEDVAVQAMSTADADEDAGQSAVAVQAGAPRSYTFAYKVTESGAMPGVSNDAVATKTVSFKVTDNGAGKLTVERVGEAADPAFAFTNTYSVEPKESSVTDQIAVTKVLTGRDQIAGEFSFELLEGDRVVATGTNDAGGNVALSAVTYTKPGMHHYVLREVGAGQVKAGVTYDGTAVAIESVVADNGDGTLNVTHKADGGAAAVKFANTYQPAAASVVLSASKTLTGKALEEGQFAFLLTASDGTVTQAKNAADGTVTFPALRFDQVGTYEFTLSEVNDAQANVTYDKRTYQVTVVVADGLQGHLNATVTSDNTTLTFENAYVEPPVPEQPGKPETPSAGGQPQMAGKATVQTGDNAMFLAAPLVAVALAGAAAMAALIMMRFRNRH